MLDDDDDDAPASTTLRNKRKDTAAQLLPRAMLELAIGLDGIKEIVQSDSFSLVIQAPSADWVKPLYKHAKSLTEWDYYLLRNNAGRTRSNEQDDAVEGTLHALAEGGKVMGVSHNPSQLLPGVMLSSADRFVVLQPVNGKIVGAVIAAITGESKEPVPNEVVVGLGFDEIAACIRQGSTREQCIDRLERASSRSRELDQAVVSAPPLTELHGYGEAQTWAENLVADIESWRRGEVSLESLDKNVVLASDPGLGKSTFVRSVAKSAGIPLVATSVGAWFANSAGYLDSIVKEIDRVFQTAQDMGPSLLFLDELDGVPSRTTMGSRNAEWWIPVVNHLLITLDGALNPKSSKIIVVGATNHPGKLDPALVRPGRLSRIITILPPSAADLIGIFRQHLGGELESDDLAAVARIAHGGSGAMVVGWVKAAKRRARVAGRAMTLADLIASVAPEDSRSQRLRSRIAVHEAGHGLVTDLLGVDQVHGLSIIPSSASGGNVLVEPGERIGTRRDIERLVMQQLAGRAAEQVVLGTLSAGAGGTIDSDLGKATQMIAMLHFSVGLGRDITYRGGILDMQEALERHPRVAIEVESDLRRLYADAVQLIERHRDLLDALVKELLAVRHIGQDRFREIVAAAADGHHEC